jgi:hypothetical protein
MRAGLSGSVPSTDLESMLTAAGFAVLGSRLATSRFDPPLSDPARQVLLGRLRRSRDQLADQLAPDDLHALDVLTDPTDPHSVLHHPAVFLTSSRQILVAQSQPNP